MLNNKPTKKTSPFIIKSLQVASINFVGKFITLASSVLFARWMGPQQLGIYSTLVAVTGMITSLSVLGFPTQLMREAARLSKNGIIHLPANVFLAAISMLIAGLFLSTVIGQVLCNIPLMPALFDISSSIGWFIPILVCTTALPQLMSSIMVGAGHARFVTSINNVAGPILTIILAVLYVFFVHPNFLDTKTRVIIQITGSIFVLISLLSAFFIKFQSSNEPILQQNTAIKQKDLWISSFLLSSIILAQAVYSFTDIIILSFYYESTTIGIYRVATSCALLLLFPLSSISSVLAPHISKSFSENRFKDIQDDLVKISRLVIALTSPLLLIYIFFPEKTIGLLFGNTYKDAAQALIILSFGYGLHVYFGPVGYVLTMTGHESIATKCLAIGALLNLLLNLIFIPYLAALGAALSTSISYGFAYAMQAYYVRKKIGFIVGPITVKDIT